MTLKEIFATTIFSVKVMHDCTVSGFSNMFFKHADEERAHGLKFIDYLRMRGNLDEDFFSSLKPIKSKSIWPIAKNSRTPSISTK